jgi:hypothetical protein
MSNGNGCAPGPPAPGEAVVITNFFIRWAAVGGRKRLFVSRPIDRKRVRRD